jgi:hypothetical protein
MVQIELSELLYFLRDVVEERGDAARSVSGSGYPASSATGLSGGNFMTSSS